MASASYYRLDSYPERYDEPLPPQHTPETQSQTQYHTAGAYDSSYENSIPIPVGQPLEFKNSVQHEPPKISNPASRLRQRKFQKLKRYLRIVQSATSVMSSLFSVIMFAIMIYVSMKFQSTKSIIRGGRDAWPKHPKLWPTIMLLVASGVTLLLSTITLLSYCFCFKTARQSWKLTIIKYVIHILVWAAVTILYRYEKSLHGNDNDLWGWSCSQKAKAIQGEFNGVVDFSSLCTVQASSFCYLKIIRS